MKNYSAADTGTKNPYLLLSRIARKKRKNAHTKKQTTTRLFLFSELLLMLSSSKTSLLETNIRSLGAVELSPSICPWAAEGGVEALVVFS